MELHQVSCDHPVGEAAEQHADNFRHKATHAKVG